CPVISLLWIMKGRASMHNMSELMALPSSQSALYDQKSGREGPRISVCHTKSLDKNAIRAKTNIDAAALIRCHLSSSRWSRKDISFSPESVIYLYNGKFFIHLLTSS